ncbi:MAG: alpha/beta hydrolase [Kiritimatiellia bacterium]
MEDGMKVMVWAMVAISVSVCAFAETIPLWTEETLPAGMTTAPERLEQGHLYDVSLPTLNFFPAPNPTQKLLPTLLVIPGGGYGCLAYAKEGTEIAQWLNGIGYSAAVLKYRIPGNRDGALDDARQALKLLRQRASAWKIDTAKMGMIGFSAGAHLTARVLHEASHGMAFALLIYPAYLSENGNTLAAEVVPSEPEVPTFIMQCRDDRNYVFSGLGYADYLIRRNCPVSFHLYATGGHGFGKQRPASSEAGHWTESAALWLKTL